MKLNSPDYKNKILITLYKIAYKNYIENPTQHNKEAHDYILKKYVNHQNKMGGVQNEMVSP